MFYKIKALQKEGVEVVLHCFEYDDRSRSLELNKYCKEVHYYKRTRSIIDWLSGLPFIVKTRSDIQLLKNLCQDDAPILFDGLHTCFFASHPKLKERKKYLRSHNIEQDYYIGLAKIEKSALKKYYFTQESKRLEKFETLVLNHVDGVFTISEADTEYFRKKGVDTTLVSAFHSNEELDLLEGDGDYVLYHGSLDVGENNEAALYLIKEVFSDLEVRLVIAGKNPSKELESECSKYSHIELKKNISSDEIHSLVQNAQINILPTFQATGIKLKLLVALFTGRYALVNDPMVQETGLESLCEIANSPEEFKEKVKALMSSSWNREEELQKRSDILLSGFGNQENVKKMVECIFD